MDRLVGDRLVGDRLVGDRLVGECADAVLRLADGDLVECSKFVMMASCPVLRAMLELRSEVRDGKYVIPVSDTGRRKYENFCNVLHRVTDILTMSFEDLLGAYDCARRFGCDEIGRSLLARAWDLAPAPKTTSMAEFVQNVLELGSGVAAHVVETAAIELPLWTDLARTFLTPLVLTEKIARDLTLLQHHYPPAAVIKWLLRRLPESAIDEGLVFELATMNSHLYGGDETRAVYAELIKLYDVHPDWDRRIPRFAAGVLASTAWNHRVEPGSYVEYENLPRTTVYATFDPPPRRTKKSVVLAPHLRIRLAPFGFDVRADLLGRATTFQVRVTASKRLSMLDPFYEAWYAFRGAATTGWTSAGDPVVRCGDMSSGGPYFVRLDVRHGAANAMLRPFDETTIT
jgi:hypothetical protein